MIVQTDIFDFLKGETKWFFNEDGFADVNVRIPSYLKTPFEAMLTNYEHKEWTNYVLAIQFFRKGTWDEAKQLFLKHRENQEKIKVRVFRRSDFRPELAR